MGKLQDRATRFAAPVEPAQVEPETPEPVDEAASADAEPDDDEPLTVAELQAEVRRRMVEAIRADLDLTDPRWIYYTLTEPLEPVEGTDRYANLKKIRLPRRLVGKHYLRVKVSGETSSESGGKVTWWEIQMSQISSFANVPMEAVVRFDAEDISRLHLVCEEIIVGNFKTSAVGAKT